MTLTARRLPALIALGATIGALALPSIVTSSAKADSGEFQVGYGGNLGVPVQTFVYKARAYAFIIGLGLLCAAVMEPVPDGEGTGVDGNGAPHLIGRPDQPLPAGKLIEQPAEQIPPAEGVGGIGIGGGPADGGAGAPGIGATPEGQGRAAVGGKPDVIAPLPIGTGTDPGVGDPADGGGGAPQVGAPFGDPDPNGTTPDAKPGKAPDGTLIPVVKHNAADGGDDRGQQPPPATTTP